jgi:hypothetical protein
MRLKKQKRLEHYQMMDRLAQRRARNRVRDKIKVIKARTGCGRCPEKDPVCLVFHHLNPKTKKFAIQKAVSSKVPWPKVLKEISKCVVLCMNCHAKLHYQEFLKKVQEEKNDA